VVYTDDGKNSAAKPTAMTAPATGPAAAAVGNDDESEDEDVDIDAIWVVSVWLW